MWMRLTWTSVTLLRKQPKRLSHAGIEITIFRVGMQSVNPSIKPLCSLLRETTQVWLLHLCFPSLTESGRIDGPRQFGPLTSHTLVEKHGVFSTTLLVGHDTLLITVPFPPMLLNLSWSEMGNTRLLTVSLLDLSLKKSFKTTLESHNTTQPTMLCRGHAGPARAARTVTVPIWPRALQWPRMGLPHKFYVIQTIYAKCSFFKIIKNVSLLACFNF